MSETLHNSPPNPTGDKVMSLSDAVTRFVSPGAHISIGGFTVSRNPMSAVHEIIRQGITDLHVYAHSNGQGLDELMGAGCVARAEIAYSGNERFAPTGFCFKRKVMDGSLKVEDYSNFQMALRFMAGAMGVPFLPTYASLGTSIIDQWGFSPEMRQDHSRISDKKLAVIQNPFAPDQAPEDIVLVPAARPEVTIIHAQSADTQGTVRMDGLTYADVDQAKAARHVIVTCETLVEKGGLNDQPGLNQLPPFCVDAVVHSPWGAYPTACFGRYDYDPAYFEAYRTWAASDEAFQNHIREMIQGHDDHAAMAQAFCGERINQLTADPHKGYATQMERN